MPKGSTHSILSQAGLEAARQPLERAATLPADAFTSPEVFALEVERIFLREWLCVGRSEQVEQVGDYFTLDLLGEKLVVVRGLDDVIRVLSRVCRHRGADMLRGSGNTRSFQCPYHSWSYHLDGRLSGAPLMEGATDFDKKRCRLPELRSELWEGWIFVNFDSEASSLGPQLAPLADFLAQYEMESKVAVETATFDSPFNWKILVDNFMEAYHHIAIHRDTLEPGLPGARSWAPDNKGPYSALVMPSRGSAEDSPGGDSLNGEDPHQLVAAVTYPSHLFAPGAHSLAWYQILPESHDRFTLRIFTCFRRETLDAPEQAELVAGIQRMTTMIHHQDIGACEATWSGLNSRSYESGSLCPLEKPIWQFNQWWLDRMQGI